MKLKNITQINQSVKDYLKIGERTIDMDNLGAMGMAVTIIFILFLIVNIVF
jgi:hypothetical protein